jgi:hypothetical protein
VTQDNNLKLKGKAWGLKEEFRDLLQVPDSPDSMDVS